MTERDYLSKMIKRRKRRNFIRFYIIIVILLISAMAFVIPDRGVAHDSEVYCDASECDDWTRYAIAMTNSDCEEILINYTGFTVSFNPVMHIPNWVAWTITASQLENPVVSRSQGTFTTDMNISGCASIYDYRNSGYDRGHMAPAADMKWNVQAMRDCFLLTNIAPQTTSLNTGAWNKLEQACRNIASVDSLGMAVVICGPVMTQGYMDKIGDSQVVVPPAFFKVVLYRRKDGALASIGFIMNNGTVEGGIQKCAMTVDEIEAVTGHDFFTTLSDSLQMIIESKYDFYNFSTGR